MKNKLLTISIKEIKKSFKRFLSLMVMSMLGVGVFVGISATAPDMTKSLDKYYDNQNLYDIKLVSTLGLTNNDIKKLKEIDSINELVGTYSEDILTTINKTESVVKFISLTDDLNKIELKEGTLPKKDNEIIVEEALLTKNKLKLGDYITLKNNDTFTNNKLKIVGVVKSPLYIGNVTASSSRGNTTIGTGKIDYYAYIRESSFNMDCYTEIYLTVKDAKKETTDSDEYLDLINDTIKSINKIKKERENNRYSELYNIGLSKINEEKTTGLIELNNAKNELDGAKNELDSAKSTLDNTKITLDNTKVMLDNTKITLNNSKIELDNTKKTLDKNKELLDTKKQELDIAKEQIENGKKEINQQVNSYDVSYDDIKNIINNNGYTGETVPTKTEIISVIPTDLPRYYEIVYGINNSDDVYKKIIQLGNQVYALDQVENLYNSGLEQYNLGLTQYNIGLDQYNEGLSKYNVGYNTYLNYEKQYNEGLNEYNNGLKTYESNYNIYTKGIEEYYNSRRIFDTKINEAYDELNKMDDCIWYIYDRLDDSSYNNYLQDGESIKNISKVFPTIFFIVAVLISLISMSRMVEDDRVEIGTLKSLGFSNKHIRLKYILYSLIATLTGGIIGSILGFYLLPYYIWNIYKILFVVEVFAIDYDFTYIILGILIALICICGTTILTIKKVVKEKPSDLMRPKAPKGGKRVLLERIPFIWNNLNFSNKITTRNLFRYKKRVLMTIVGILGCTSLILIGFGIRDAIVDIADIQYNEIFTFDDIVYLDGDNSDNDIKELLTNQNIKNYVSTKMTSGTSKKYSTNLFVPNEESTLENVLHLKDLDTKEKISLIDNEAIISDKLAELTNTKVGEKIEFTDSEGKTYKFKVSDICENYAGNYIFINKKTYENKIGNYSTNVVYLNLKDSSKEKSLEKELIEKEKVMSIVSSTQTISNIRDMLKTLDSVVLILIFLSGALSFVVLYNLSFINISERKRELATLKVLGFTDKEVDNYINKETIILTFIGIIFGLLLGIVLTNFIVDTVEVEIVRFIHRINMLSFIMSALMTITFTIIVNIITHFTLKKIDMIESLKSVE